MRRIEVQDVLISANAKTGLSINVDQCSPTKWCYQHCYRRFRTMAMIAKNGWSSTPNTGPVTWRLQQAAYKRNEEAIKAASAEGRLDEIACMVVQRVRAKGLENLRGNGTGDLFSELCEFYARLAMHGLNVFLFSRRPSMVAMLLNMCNEFGVPVKKRPFVMGSVDKTTTRTQWTTLKDATRRINGKAALAYSTDAAGREGRKEVEAHPARRSFVVVFGYHSNQTRTVLEHPLECPATAGADVKCNVCRHCYGH